MAQCRPLKIVNGRPRHFGPGDTIDPDILATGVRNGSNVLRDDGTWAASGSGGYNGDPATVQQDATHRFVSDTEKTTWNGKAAGNHNHTGIYSPTDHEHAAYALTGHNHSGVYAPAVHNHDSSYSATNHNHSGVYAPSAHNHDTTYAPVVHTHNYEPSNSNIQTHISSAHAPANAQKNSDILKSEIEAVLTGVIASHSHAGGADPFLAKLRLAGDITNATLTPLNLTGMSFAYLANSFYIFDLYMACTSAAATTGYGFAVDVSTVVTTHGLIFVHQLATAGTLSGGDSIADNVSRGLSSGVPAVTVINPIMGRGFLMTGANAGTAQFTFRPEVAASATVKAGSVITVMKIA